MKNPTRPKLVLLDSHAIIHRAYHALPEFLSSKGEPTGAVYGLATMLMKIITDLKPDYIVACYDLPQKTFRHEAYDNYKAGRAKADDALVAQLKSSRKLFEAFQIPMYDMPGFEADDMLGTIVAQVKSKKIDVDVIVASGDMDTLQLVDKKHVQVFTLKKGINDTILYDEEKVFERFNFKPKLLVDYKGLRGDPSDNIIGVKGIGEKTATTLVSQIGTIEEIYKVLKKDDSRLKELGITPRVKQLLIDNEEEALFSKTLATIRHDAPIDFVLPHTFIEHLDLPRIETLFQEFEFKSLIPRVRALRSQGGVSPHIESESPVAEIESYDETLFQELALGMWLINSELTSITPHDILLYTKTKKLEEAKSVIEAKIREDGIGFVYDEIEKPLMPLVREMESNGITIDVEYLKKLSNEYHKELSLLEQSIWKYAGREFNINSPKQLGEVLFDEMNLEAKGMKKTAGGARSTRESELEKLRELHPIVDEIFKYRELQKLLSTYIDTIPSLVSEDGRLHAGFNQAGTTTGRFSSQNPNLQNIPNKTELGKRIRDGFVAAEGKVLVSFDYSQIELRIAALMSQDSYLIKTFEDKKDVHAAVAAKVFGVPESEVTSDMRRKAKVINFGILYGMGVNALRTNLGSDRKEAQEFYDNYFAQFPTINGFIEKVIADAKKNAYTTTLFGRRRQFPAFKSKIPYIVAMAERMAINAPLQGTSADIIKLSIVKIDEFLKSAEKKEFCKLLLQVHDELIYEIDKSEVPGITTAIKDIMEKVVPPLFTQDIKSVPLEIHVSEGMNWGELK